jgi:hypothetical protein
VNLFYKAQFSAFNGNLFNFPRSACKDSQGNFYVITGNGISKFDSSYNWIVSSPDDPSANYWDMIIGPTGLLYVSTQSQSVVSVFDPTTMLLLRQIHDSNIQTPFGIAFDSHRRMFVCDGNDFVNYFDNEVFVSKFSIGPGNNGEPIGIAIDKNDFIYVTDRNNQQVCVYDASYNLVNFFGSNGHGDGQFTEPTGIAVDDSGNIFVADTVDHRIQVFKNDGTFITKFGSIGTAPGQFSQPNSLKFYLPNDLVVADATLNRVQILGELTTSMPLLDAIADWLITQGVVGGSTGWPMFRGFVPPDPDQAIIVTEIPGEDTDIIRDLTIGEQPFDTVGFQIRGRGAVNNYQSLRNQMQVVFQALHQMEPPTVQGERFVFIYAKTSGPLPMGKDTQNRDELSWNFRAMRLR